MSTTHQPQLNQLFLVPPPEPQFSLRSQFWLVVSLGLLTALNFGWIIWTVARVLDQTSVPGAGTGHSRGDILQTDSNDDDFIMHFSPGYYCISCAYCFIVSVMFFAMVVAIPVPGPPPAPPMPEIEPPPQPPPPTPERIPSNIHYQSSNSNNNIKGNIFHRRKRLKRPPFGPGWLELVGFRLSYVMLAEFLLFTRNLFGLVEVCAESCQMEIILYAWTAGTKFIIAWLASWSVNGALADVPWDVGDPDRIFY